MAKPRRLDKQPIEDLVLERVNGFPVYVRLPDSMMERFLEALEIDGRARAEVLRDIVNEWSWRTLRKAKRRASKA